MRFDADKARIGDTVLYQPIDFGKSHEATIVRIWDSSASTGRIEFGVEFTVGNQTLRDRTTSTTLTNTGGTK